MGNQIIFYRMHYMMSSKANQMQVGSCFEISGSLLLGLAASSICRKLAQ